MNFWDFEIHTIKMKLEFWCHLKARRKRHLDTIVICKAAQKEGIDIFNTTAVAVIEIIKQLHINLKQHYQDDRARRDIYLLNKANLELDTGDAEKK